MSGLNVPVGRLSQILSSRIALLIFLLTRNSIMHICLYFLHATIHLFQLRTSPSRLFSTSPIYHHLITRSRWPTYIIFSLLSTVLQMMCPLTSWIAPFHHLVCVLSSWISSVTRQAYHDGMKFVKEAGRGKRRRIANMQYGDYDAH